MQLDYTSNEEALHAVTARFFKGLGDPVRLQILELLAAGERSVGAIVDQVGQPQNKVSMHLGCLRWCGYVRTRREGRFVFYSLGDPRVTEIIGLAREMLNGSEVYLMTCDVIGKTDENLTNVTGWRGSHPESGDQQPGDVGLSDERLR